METKLTDIEYNRYARHILLPEIGVEGQQKLKNASVALVGLGGLGSPAALYLAASGVGRLGLIDDDRVDLSNLQRQILFEQDHCSQSKATIARNKLSKLNPHIQLDLYPKRLNADNAEEILSPYDIVIDGSDNFATRYLVNDVCVIHNKALIHGSIYKFDGQLSIFATNNGPCYRCLYPKAPTGKAIPNCAEAGVIGVLPGIIGTLQATEAIKLILNFGTPLIGKLLQYDARDLSFRKISIKANETCAMCSPSAPKKLFPEDYQTPFCKFEDERNQINEKQLEQELSAQNDIQLLDVRSSEEHACARIADSKLIPLTELQQRCHELDKEKSIIIYCQSGKRSLQAVECLIENGFKKCKSLNGGILAWSQQGKKVLRGYGDDNKQT